MSNLCPITHASKHIVFFWFLNCLSPNIELSKIATTGKHDNFESRGGTLGISGWGCATGTLEPLTYTRASSAEFCYPILEQTAPISV